MYRSRRVLKHHKSQSTRRLAFFGGNQVATFRHFGKQNLQKLLFFAIVGFVFSIRVLITAKVATEGGRIKTYEGEIVTLKEEIAKTNMEIAQISSLASIEKRAVDELQMIVSKKGIVFLEGYQDVFKIAKY